MIPFLDLQLQHREIETELVEAAKEVILSGRYVLGEHNEAFESAFAGYCGSAEAVTVSTGTAALHLALLAADVGPGDEVITTPATFVATVAAIQYVGATVRLVDIDAATWTLDPDRLEAAITPRTKAVVPVHLHGRLSDMTTILAVARDHGLLVIEDAAQAHGAEHCGRRAGAWGDFGCFSFYPGKNLGACGEGGAVTTQRDDFAERLRLLRDWGQRRKYQHAQKGFNYRMDELQAALLEVKLPHLDRWTNLRRQAAARYDHELAGDSFGLPAPPAGLEHAYHIYAIRTPDRDAVQRKLAQRVTTNIHYPTPVHLQPAYADLGYREGDFPVAEQLARETLSLPMFPGITEAQIVAVCDGLRRAARSRSQVRVEAA